jgi:hypothetical protein
MVERIIELSKNGDVQTQDDFGDDDDDNELSYHHRVPSILDELDWNDITELIDGMDAKPGMSLLERQLARMHKNTILSMRRQLTQKKHVMRASYKGYSFHTYAAKEFEEKSSNYIKNTGIYTCIDEVDPKNPEVSQRCLMNIVQQVDTTLQDLLHSKSISDRQYVLMHPKRSIVRLNYLHFVPDRYQVRFSFFFVE